MDAARILLSPQIMEADPACTGSGEYDYHGSDSEDDSSTSTLDSIVVRHVFENGRRYHGFRTGRYLQPNDKQEQDRMDMIHHCLKVALTGPYTAPLATLNPLRRILDLGTGTGRWAVGRAYEFPGVKVTGIDLSPIQPVWVPSNLDFEIDDIESPWTQAPGSVDYIYARNLSRSINDWPALLEQCITALRPGGMIEITDTTVPFAPPGEVGNEYLDLLTGGYKQLGRIITHNFPTLLTGAGFIGVVETLGRLPIGMWPLQPQMKELGRMWKECVLAGLEAESIALLTREMGWSKEEVDVLVGNLRREILARMAFRVSRVGSWVAVKP